MYTNAYSIWNSPKLETIPMSLSWQMDKQIIVYPYSGILLSDKKKGGGCPTDMPNMGESQKHYCKQKNSDTKAIPRMIPLV